MPPPILHDSEGEEDEVVYDDPRDSLSRSSGESAPGIPALDSTRDTLNQSTGSTGKASSSNLLLYESETDYREERLKRQIDDAQRRLVDSNEQQQTHNSNRALLDTVSPTVRRDKRRHSLARPAESAVSTVKRAKTTDTYSTKKPSASSIEREKFLTAFEDDATAPNTSPPIRFSDHSCIGGSSGLPAGSLQAGFANHEPAMFRESGSTIPDNESSHERMVEQALRSKSLRGLSSPGMKLVESDEMPKSSSFPWSASEQTEVTRSHLAKDGQAAVTGLDLDDKTVAPQAHAFEGGQPGKANDAMPTDDDIPAPATAVMTAPSAPTETPQSSPIVHVDPNKMEAPPRAEPDPASAEKTQRPGRGRKRKVQEESSEPLNSDDIAVGLPKERYKPRPSRRRATEVVDERIDYSMVPEKAAKSKRSKTLGSSSASTGPLPQSTGKLSKPTKQSKAQPIEFFDVVEHATTTANEYVTLDPLSGPSTQVYKPSPIVEVSATIEMTPSQPKEVTPQLVFDPVSQPDKTTDKEDDFVFAKPALKRKPVSKSKRSSTTIFEDHVDFTGKSRSPSLSQQQAMRKSALTDVKNESSLAKRKRNSKAVIPDDDDEAEDAGDEILVKVKRTHKLVVRDDDEDELAFDPNVQDEQADQSPDEASKKRGRGHPANSSSNTDTETPARSAKQKQTEQTEQNDETPPTGPEEPPKKRRGRPPKTPAPVQDTDEPEDADDNEEAQFSPQPAAKPSTENNKPCKPTVTEISTPSPEAQEPKEKEKENAAADNNKKLPKVSPVAHSPIKSSSPAPYRVGLSKKHRIPSLLRVMRPPPALVGKRK
jgi:hypothetical protein